jgi:hypothetical protein
MNVEHKLGIGAILSLAGGMGMVLAPTLGFTALGRPWSFIAGLVVGIACGIGVVLVVSGLLDRRARR